MEKGRPPPTSTGERWIHIRQNKHHPWSLDEGQILQYHLGGALHPHVRWWEAMEVPRRTINFVEHGDGVMIVSLVCEDLAQIDNVAEVIRSVGATLVFTPLLDGPQLNSRWAARYASVLADDPGSAVLTLTSAGMARRSRPHGLDPLPVIALWKDPVRGLREIQLEAGAQGVLLTVCYDRITRRSADCRRPVDNVIECFAVAVHQVRASNRSLEQSNVQSGTPAPPVLEAEELTILTGWTQALAEALVHEPERIETLLTDAQAGAPWRAAFGMAELSPRLSEALRFLGGVVRGVAPPGGIPTAHALLISLGADRPEEQGLEMLVHRVLRSTLEPVCARQADKTHLSTAPGSALEMA
jgi:hypothetical protein